MALGHKSIQSRNRLPGRSGWTRRRGLILAAVVVCMMALAWFDGGEEPLHPISQEIPVPEGR